MTGLPPTGLDADPLIGAEIAQYRIDERIARGGMGVVYRAEHVRLGRTVALKVIAPELSQDHSYRSRFELEAKAAASIDDANAVPIYDYGEQDGRLYIVMRYIEGPDLATLIEEEGALSAERAADFVAQAASALDAAHASGLVHRDVKPANLLIDRVRGRDHVFVTDFGLIRAASASRSGLTRTGGVVGTLDFIAPEQIADDPVSARTDVYALGCVLYYALAGEVPFPRGSDAAKLNAHLTADPPALSDADVDARLGPVLTKAMAKRPDDRFQSAGELGAAALAVLDSGNSRVGWKAPPRPPPEPDPVGATDEPMPPPPAEEPKPPPATESTPTPRDRGRGRPARLATLAAVACLAGVAGAAVAMLIDAPYQSVVEAEANGLDLISFGLLALAALAGGAVWIRRGPVRPVLVLATTTAVAGWHASMSATFLDWQKFPGVLAAASELCLVAAGVLTFAAAAGTLRGPLPGRRIASLFALGGGLVAAGMMFVRFAEYTDSLWDEAYLRFKLPLAVAIGAGVLLAIRALSKSTLGVGLLRCTIAGLAFGYTVWWVSAAVLLDKVGVGPGLVGLPVALLVAFLAALVAVRPAVVHRS